MPKLEARMAPLHIMAVQEAVLIMMTKMISLQQITMMKMKMMMKMSGYLPRGLKFNKQLIDHLYLMSSLLFELRGFPSGPLLKSSNF